MKIKSAKSGKRVRKGQRIVAGLFATVLIATSVFVKLKTEPEADGISRACRNSEACMAAVAKEREANANAASAAGTASMYQAKVGELNMQIAQAELQIADTEAQIENLNGEIEKAEAKLEKTRQSLAEMLVKMHFDEDADDNLISILAGSNSLSELADKEARSEVMRQQIATMAAKVKTTKAQLEADKAKVEELLAQQQAAKADLEKTRAEQQALVAKYQNDQAAYEALAAEAAEAMRKAEQEEQEAHPERYGGSAYTGYNTYKWQYDCPGNRDAYGTTINGYYVGGYVCECVSYVGWKAYEAFGLYLAWGNAYSWDDRARALGYRVDNTPAEDTIGQIDGYPYGHVFWVESVNADGSINVTEYNNAQATYLYSGDYHYYDFGSRKIPASEIWRYNFIHLE